MNQWIVTTRCLFHYFILFTSLFLFQLLIKWLSDNIFNFDHLQDSKKGWAIDKEFFSVLNSRICKVVTN